MQLSKWGKEFDMEQWNFLKEFIKLQKQEKSKDEKEIGVSDSSIKITPDRTFIKDIHVYFASSHINDDYAV